MGLRELKKAKTRKVIGDTALRLFLEKGYNNVTVAEIAQLSEVSVTTVFKYFPCKESLVFDEIEEYDEGLVRAVTSRPVGSSVMDSLHEFYLSIYGFIPSGDEATPELSSAFHQLTKATPELAEYSRRVWMGRAEMLAQVIQREAKTSIEEAAAIAHLIQLGANWAMDSESPQEAFEVVFRLLKRGWNK
jgi:AcrR family transcriptional regulator